MVKVTLRCSLLETPVERRALVANLNHVTQISERLAQELGLMNNSHVVYVSPGPGIGGTFQLKWRIATSPMIIAGLPEAMKQKSYVVYPIFNTSNAFYDLIIGRDCFKQSFEILSYSINNNVEGQDEFIPSPGPGFVEGGHYMGHNILLTPYEDIPMVDEFLEFPAHTSRSVRRLAINRVTRQLLCVYRSSNVVYCYHQLPAHLQQQIENGALTGQTMTAVNDACAMETMSSFPDTVLVNPLNAIV